jgi:hypothetical protein
VHDDLLLSSGNLAALVQFFAFLTFFLAYMDRTAGCAVRA